MHIHTKDVGLELAKMRRKACLSPPSPLVFALSRMLCILRKYVQNIATLVLACKRLSVFACACIAKFP